MNNGKHPPTKRIACDECPAIVGEELVYPHVDQWIDLIPLSTMGEMFTIGEYSRLIVDIAAAEGDEAETRALNRKLLGNYGEIHEMLANRILAWNWTDAIGRELGDPTDPKSYRSLTQTEMWWLVNTMRTGGASAESGKDSSGTETTGSDSSPLADPTKSSTAPSLQVVD